MLSETPASAIVLSVPTTDTARPTNDNPDSNRDFLVAGRDTIQGDGGDDIIFGDHGIVQQMLPAAQKILNVRRVTDIRTDQLTRFPPPADGGRESAVLALFGEDLLKALHNEPDSFRIAGGIMLFIIGLNMVFEKRTETREERAEEENDFRNHQKSVLLLREEISRRRHLFILSLFC